MFLNSKTISQVFLRFWLSVLRNVKDVLKFFSNQTKDVSLFLRFLRTSKGFSRCFIRFLRLLKAVKQIFNVFFFLGFLEKTKVAYTILPAVFCFPEIHLSIPLPFHFFVCPTKGFPGLS